MCTGSSVGHIAVWDLEKRKLHSQIRSAHNAAVTGLRFLPSQPLLVTSSADNSLKVKAFADCVVLHWVQVFVLCCVAVLRADHC